MLKIVSLIFLFTNFCFAQEITTDKSSDFKQEQQWTLALSPFVQMINIDIQASETTNASQGDYSYFGSSIDLYRELLNHIHFHSAYMFGYSSDNATSYNGFELGGRYYFKGRGGKTTTYTPQVTIEESGSYAFWLETNYKQIRFESQTTFVKYSGVNLKVGGEYKFYQDFYLGAYIGYDILSSGEYRSLTALKFGLSLMHTMNF